MAIDQLIIGFDRALRTVFLPASSVRSEPGSDLPEGALTESERQHAGRLMRVNHVGEVCAQALYQGQALVCDDHKIVDSLKEAAQQEEEHLAWTKSRISALGGRTSYLNPVWYLGALGIGVCAGLMGAARNLGFLAETERQVEAHLLSHAEAFPAADAKSLAVVEQMRLDEIEHAQMALQMGGSELPFFVRKAMKVAGKVMTSTAYYL